MSSDAGAIGWYARRLARMSAPEIAYRLVEHGRRIADGRRRFGWDRFGDFDSPISDLPGLAGVRTGAMLPDDDIAAIASGRFDLLGQDWPAPPPGRPWYADGAVWHLDPVSAAPWPGRDTFAFAVPYRHERRRGDVKFVWELNRLQILQPLAAAGRTDIVAAILESWMAANPPFQGINWVSGIEAASRIVSLLVVLAFADEGLRQRLDGCARRFLAAHAFWIDRYPSLHSSANNHRVAELAGLFLAAVAAPGLPGAERHRMVGRHALETLACRLFHTDGVGAEQSPTYAAYALEWFVLAGVAADAAGLPFSHESRARLHAAATHLRWMMDDEGRVPRIGDDDEGRVLVSSQGREDRYVASVVAAVSRWLGDPALQPPATDPHLRDQLVPVPREPATPATGPTGCRVFADGGYSVVRTPTERGTRLFVLDHGPLGFASIAAHGHADALAVWLHWGDEAILVDAGTYLYHSGGPARDLFRGTRVHNTLALEDLDQSTIAGPFNWSRHARAGLVDRRAGSITAEHDGYVGAFGLRHRRTIDVSSDGVIVIEDRLLGEARSAALRWSIGFTLGTGVVPHLDGPRATLVTAAGRRLSLELSSAEAGWTLAQAPFSPAFNRRDTLPRLCAAGTVGPAVVATTRIRFTATGTDPADG